MQLADREETIADAGENTDSPVPISPSLCPKNEFQPVEPFFEIFSILFTEARFGSPGRTKDADDAMMRMAQLIIEAFIECFSTTNATNAASPVPNLFPQSALSQIESGTIYPSFPTMLYLNSTYRLNVSWLISGEGNMFLHATDAFTAIDNAGRLDQPKYIQLLKAMEDKRIERLIFNRLSDSFVFFGKNIE